jgi:carbohydrate-binding DOMON domain-containing protein
VARFDMGGAVRNPWNSAIRLSLQTFDLYIDVDPGSGTGGLQLLEGRNASLADGFGWEYAVWVEGWSQRVLVPDAAGRPKELPGTPVKVIVSEPDGMVTVIVDRSVLKADTPASDWAYAAAVLSQEGFPSSGVRRVRDIQSDAAQWRLGGAPDDTNHTRIVDLAWPAGTVPTQEQMLLGYESTKASVDSLGPGDFARVGMIRPGPAP